MVSKSDKIISKNIFTPNFLGLCKPASNQEKQEDQSLALYHGYELETLPADRFKDEELVGKGSYGSVFKTWDTKRNIVSENLLNYAD